MKHFDVYPASLGGRQPKQLGEDPTIHDGCRVVDSKIGGWTELMRGTTLVESTFGDYSYTAGDVSIVYADVGKFCSIASHVRINPGNHPMWRVTQHHATYRRRQYGFDEADDAEFFQWRRDHRCRIGHDVWIGHGAIVMPGVTVGNGAVIGSGAVVTKDVLPYQIVGGVPSRSIRFRFEPRIVRQLQEIAWWDWDRATLEARFDELLDLEGFLKKYAQGPWLSPTGAYPVAKQSAARVEGEATT